MSEGEMPPVSAGNELSRFSDRVGFATLTIKEIKRFWSVLGQTVTAPVITALLYLLVFA